MRAKAASKGGLLAEDAWLGSDYKYSWRCAEGHEWRTTWASIANGSWCGVCKGNSPRNLDELRIIVKSRGGKILSDVYKGVDATYDFKCSIGHSFSNTFKHVEAGQWCPTCNKGSKSEEIARTTFEQIFQLEFKKVRPKWLKNSRNRQMEIDGFCKELNIGFEYQGIQHFGKQFYGTSLEQRISDDQLKAKLCEENGVRLFILDYRMEYSDFPKEIEAQAKKFGIQVNNHDFTKPIDLNRAYIRDDRLPKLVELLKPKQITVLSTKWIGVKDSYQFRCDVCGHEWSATGSHFFNSRRVGGCKKCSMKILAGSNRLTLEEMQVYANQFGGKCLSTKYGEIKQKYKFECSRGHIFEDIFNNMKYRKTFCPTCEGRSSKRYLSDDEALALMKKFNLEPISPRPKRITVGWPAKCLVCGEKVKTSIGHLLDRESPCKYCSGFAISETKALKVFQDNHFEPIEPFTSGTKPWKSKCLNCGSIVRPRYDLILKGTLCCRTCYLNSKRQK